jgi:hypothetical protein
LFLTACLEEKKVEIKQPTLKKYERIPGEIQVLNGTDILGMASSVREFLMGKGYDVVETGNASEQNYPQTLIVYRNPEWDGRQFLEKNLHNPLTMVLENDAKLVDVTIFVGRDIQEWLTK